MLSPGRRSVPGRLVEWSGAGSWDTVKGDRSKGGGNGKTIGPGHAHRYKDIAFFSGGGGERPGRSVGG